jgi:transposase
VHCEDCGSHARERLDFCPSQGVGYTKWLAKYVLALRADMSIRAVAEHTGLHWQTVKDIEKAYLARKYAKVPLGEVRRLGIDEVYLGRTFGYITVVRDLESGAVLFIGKGKGGEALEPFKRRPHKSKRWPSTCPMPMLHGWPKCSRMPRSFTTTSMSSN